MALLQAMIDADSHGSDPSDAALADNTGAAASDAASAPTQSSASDRMPLAAGVDLRALRAAVRAAALAKASSQSATVPADEASSPALASDGTLNQAMTSALLRETDTGGALSVIAAGEHDAPRQSDSRDEEDTLGTEWLIALATAPPSPPSDTPEAEAASVDADLAATQRATPALDTTGPARLAWATPEGPSSGGLEVEAGLPADTSLRTGATPESLDAAEETGPSSDAVALPQQAIDADIPKVIATQSPETLEEVPATPEPAAASGPPPSPGVSSSARALFQSLREQGVLEIERPDQASASSTSADASEQAAFAGADSTTADQQSPSFNISQADAAQPIHEGPDASLAPVTAERVSLSAEPQSAATLPASETVADVRSATTASATATPNTTTTSPADAGREEIAPGPDTTAASATTAAASESGLGVGAPGSEATASSRPTEVKRDQPVQAGKMAAHKPSPPALSTNAAPDTSHPTPGEITRDVAGEERTSISSNTLLSQLAIAADVEGAVVANARAFGLLPVPFLEARRAGTANGRDTDVRSEMRIEAMAAASASFNALFLAPVTAVESPTPLTEHQQRELAERANSGLIYGRRNELLSPADAAHALQVFAAVEQTAADTEVAEPEAAEPRPHALPNEQAVAATLVQSMRVQYRDGVGSAVVQLDPEYLGKVTIVLETSGGSVNATLHAANGEVRAWLQTHEQSLRQGLAEKGLSLNRLTVSDAERAEESLSRDGRERQSPQEQRRPRRPAARRGEAGTFEVVV